MCCPGPTSVETATRFAPTAVGQMPFAPVHFPLAAVTREVATQQIAVHVGPAARAAVVGDPTLPVSTLQVAKAIGPVPTLFPVVVDNVDSF